jgi:ABC-type microcin C transport system duplicated ATPase subunit YejF
MEDKNQEVILEMKDLSISFFNKSGEIQAVRGINYTLHKGEVLGIVEDPGNKQPTVPYFCTGNPCLSTMFKSKIN